MVMPSMVALIDTLSPVIVSAQYCAEVMFTCSIYNSPSAVYLKNKAAPLLPLLLYTWNPFSVKRVTVPFELSFQELPGSNRDTFPELPAWSKSTIVGAALISDIKETASSSCPVVNAAFETPLDTFPTSETT